MGLQCCLVGLWLEWQSEVSGQERGGEFKSGCLLLQNAPHGDNCVLCGIN